MEKLERGNDSFWRKNGETTRFSKLDENVRVDVAIVGGGISGILTAYLLAKEGKSVALLEAREMVSGSTGGTTAKISSQHQLIYNEVLQRDGIKIAKDYYEANEAGKKLIKRLVKEHEIDCDFSTIASYVYTQDEDNIEAFEKEANAYEKIGINGKLINELPLSLSVSKALIMNDQAQFNPVKFLNGILEEIVALGGLVFEHTMYTETAHSKNKLVLSTDTEHTVTCDQVIFATLFPAEDPDSYYSNTLKPVTSHLTAFESPDAFDTGMYISDDSPKRTFRGANTEKQHVLIVGGETHPTGDGKSTEEHYKDIELFAEREFGLTKMLGYWSEHDLVTPDRRPMIGPIEKGDEQMYVMTGFSKWGLAAAAAGAQLITDLLTGKENRFENLFNPERKMPDDKEENASEEDMEIHKLYESTRLKKEEAMKFEKDGEPAGMYKDSEGKIHYLDLSCTHLGCEVKWNDGDKTWDCPCHGSVFDGDGSVLAGPAKEPLKKIHPYAK